jgi:hypothetical protein
MKLRKTRRPLKEEASIKKEAVGGPILFKQEHQIAEVPEEINCKFELEATREMPGPSKDVSQETNKSQRRNQKMPKIEFFGSQTTFEGSSQSQKSCLDFKREETDNLGLEESEFKGPRNPGIKKKASNSQNSHPNELTVKPIKKLGRRHQKMSISYAARPGSLSGEERSSYANQINNVRLLSYEFEDEEFRPKVPKGRQFEEPYVPDPKVVKRATKIGQEVMEMVLQPPKPEKDTQGSQNAPRYTKSFQKKTRKRAELQGLEAVENHDCREDKEDSFFNDPDGLKQSDKRKKNDGTSIVVAGMPKKKSQLVKRKPWEEDLEEEIGVQKKAKLVMSNWRVEN